MYYRYRAQRNSQRIIKRILIVVTLLLVAFISYRYRDYLQFWKLSTSRLERQITDAAAIGNNSARQVKLQELETRAAQLRKEEPLDADTYRLSGLIHFYRALSLHGKGDFTRQFIDESERKITPQARNEYQNSIIYLQKSYALNRESKPRRDTSFIFARACFATEFYGPGDILESSIGFIEPSGVKNPDDRRFYAVMYILVGKIDQGIELLKKHGSLGESLDDRLFLARSFFIAARYTEAMEIYLSLLSRAENQALKQRLEFYIARIYFRRYLYRESLDYLNRILAVDNRNQMIRQWKGMVLFSLNRKDEAREALKGMAVESFPLEKLRNHLGEL